MSDISTRLTPLLEMLYDASVDPQQWPTAVQSITTAFDASFSGIVVQDLATGAFPLATSDGPADVLAQYVAHYGARDPLRAAAAQRMCEPLTNARLVTPQIRRTETYNDFYRRFQMEHFIGCGWGREEGQLGSLVSYRGPDAGPFSAEDERLFSLVIPHLRRAVSITSRLRAASEETATLQDVLDRFVCAVILVDRSGRVRRTNRSADELLARRDGLCSTEDGLRAASSNETVMLRGMVAAASSESSFACPSQISLSRPSGALPLTVVAAPFALYEGTRGAMLLVQDPGQVLHDDQHLRATYGFTPTEADIALRIVGGSSLTEICEERSSSIHTVRSHVKQLLHKANARNQADLVRIVLSSPAAAVRRNAS